VIRGEHNRLKVSIALLTKNGGELLKQCLHAICSQRLASTFEILAIDSGSSDGSQQVLKGHSRVIFSSIPASEFQHGRTRNLAMRRARGELVVFLTQDAVPTGEDWLARLVEFMDMHPEVAGAFGRQIAHADADPLEASEIARHFETFTNRPSIFRAAPAPGDSAFAAQAPLHYFSNVNSCIRKQSWERIPFPEIEFGEDQAWAFEIQKAGLATGYVEWAVVRHSHAYGTLDLFRRRYDEARFMRRQFGYALVPSWQDAARIARMHTASFRLHLAGLSPNPVASPWLHAAIRAWASSLGRFAGTRLANRDGLVHRCLSLTEKNRRD
jgi:rhamnosyltransferase